MIGNRVAWIQRAQLETGSLLRGFRDELIPTRSRMEIAVDFQTEHANAPLPFCNAAT